MLGGERKVNKISKRNYSIDVRTASYLRQYCSGMPKLLAFNTPHEGLFFMFGVPNAKYLAFGTIDENALKNLFLSIPPLALGLAFLLHSYLFILS